MSYLILLIYALVYAVVLASIEMLIVKAGARAFKGLLIPWRVAFLFSFLVALCSTIPGLVLGLLKVREFMPVPFVTGVIHLWAVLGIGTWYFSRAGSTVEGAAPDHWTAFKLSLLILAVNVFLVVVLGGLTWLAMGLLMGLH